LDDRQQTLHLAQMTEGAVVGHFLLPPEAWWSGYYRCLEENISLFRRRYREDSTALRVLDREQAEIDLYREHHDTCGDGFHGLRVDD
jgi:hypothetical protein